MAILMSREERSLNYKIAGSKTAYTEHLETLLQSDGHKPFDGKEMDLFLYTIKPAACRQTDYKKLLENYEQCAIGLLQAVNEALPFMQSGKKRLCFVTDIQSSVNKTAGAEGWEKSILSACNMAIVTLFNRLHAEGFTFRVFAVEDFETENPMYAMQYFLTDRSMEEGSPKHSDENRIVMRNWQEQEIPW